MAGNIPPPEKAPFTQRYLELARALYAIDWYPGDLPGAPGDPGGAYLAKMSRTYFDSYDDITNSIVIFVDHNNPATPIFYLRSYLEGGDFIDTPILPTPSGTSVYRNTIAPLLKLLYEAFAQPKLLELYASKIAIAYKVGGDTFIIPRTNPPQIGNPPSIVWDTHIQFNPDAPPLSPAASSINTSTPPSPKSTSPGPKFTGS